MAEYIDREAAKAAIVKATRKRHSPYNAIVMLPAADVRPVVLCRDCQYWQSDCGWCGLFDIGMNVRDYCSRWKKMEGS